MKRTKPIPFLALLSLIPLLLLACKDVGTPPSPAESGSGSGGGTEAVYQTFDLTGETLPPDAPRLTLADLPEALVKQGEDALAAFQNELTLPYKAGTVVSERLTLEGMDPDRVLICHKGDLIGPRIKAEGDTALKMAYAASGDGLTLVTTAMDIDMPSDRACLRFRATESGITILAIYAYSDTEKTCSEVLYYTVYVLEQE